MDQELLVRTGIALGALALVAFVLVRRLGLEKPWLPPWSLLRAVVQLGLLSLVLHGVINDLRYVILFLLVMVLAAAGLVASRSQRGWRFAGVTAIVIAVSAGAPSALVFASGAIDARPRYLLAVGGIVVGGIMTVSTLFARHLRERLIADRDEVEGWLAIGATPRQAAWRSVQRAGSSALVPSTDQTRVAPGVSSGSGCR